MFTGKYALRSGAFLTPNPNGKWVVTVVHNPDDPFRVKVSDNNAHDQHGWLMPDGRISLINLESKGWYRKRVDTLISKKGSTWRVIGRYPFYLAISPKGERHVVFIDHDASFCFEYVDFEARVFQRYKDDRLAREMKAERRAKKIWRLVEKPNAI